MVDAINKDLFARVKENIHEDHHYKFKPWEKEGAVIKDVTDSNKWTILHHYLHLCSNVDMNVVNMLVKDQGVDVKAEANQKNNAMIIAAKNTKCKFATLQGLADMGVDIKSMCDADATVLQYYVRYTEACDYECVKWMIAQGVDPKHGDKNKMTSLHYTMINFNAGYEQIQFLVEAGADINAKMAQEIDCLDLVIYTQNMKNANYHRILGLVRYLVKNMECKDFDLRKLTVISAMLTWDRLQMCKLRNNVANMKPQKGCFVLPEAVFGHLAQYV